MWGAPPAHGHPCCLANQLKNILWDWVIGHHHRNWLTNTKRSEAQKISAPIVFISGLGFSENLISHYLGIWFFYSLEIGQGQLLKLLTRSLTQSLFIEPLAMVKYWCAKHSSSITEYDCRTLHWILWKVQRNEKILMSDSKLMSVDSVRWTIKAIFAIRGGFQKHKHIWPKTLNNQW